MRAYFRLVFLIAVAVTAQPVHAAFGSIWVFGDSLADSGNAAALVPDEPFPYTNLVPNGAYASNTFSNGPVWVQYLAGSLGLPLTPILAGGTNYAFGGAQTGPLAAIGLGPGTSPSVLAQAGFAAAAAGSLPADGLYIVSGGGNDVRRATDYVANGGAIGDAATAMAQAAVNLAVSISTLADAGARQFLVPNLPNIGLTPEQQLAGSPGIAGALSVALNSLLSTALNNLQVARPTLDITLVDTFSLSNAVFADPLAFGFTNVSAACTLQNGGTGCANPGQYLFWDGLHPTTRSHLLSAEFARAQLVPLPPALWLMGSALAVVLVRRRGHQR